MGASCGSREWTKEEMMAYLDFSNAEDARIEARVANEMRGNQFSSRRGYGDVLDAAWQDGLEQQAFYS